MKVFLLALFVAAAVASPVPLDEEIGEPVELVVNSVPEGEPLELGDVLAIKVKEHADGVVVSSSDLLHPLTAIGMAEAAAAADQALEIFPALPEPVPGARKPRSVDSELEFEPVVLPEPPSPEVELEPVVLPEPPAPEVIPDPVAVPEPEFNPEPVPHPPSGEIFNDGLVQVKVNGVLSTVQSWFSMFLNYFNGDVQTTHQIV